MSGWSVRIISWGMGPADPQMTWQEAEHALKAQGIDVEFEGGSNLHDSAYFSCPIDTDRGFVRSIDVDDYQRLNGKRFAVRN